MDLDGHNLLMFWLEAEQFAEYTGNARECLDRARGMVERHLGLTPCVGEVSLDSDDGGNSGRSIVVPEFASDSSRSSRTRNTTLMLTQRVRQQLRQAVSADGDGSSSMSNRLLNYPGHDDDDDDEWCGGGSYGSGGSGAGCSMPSEDEDASIDPEEDAVVGDRWGRYGAQSKTRHYHAGPRWSGARWQLKAAAHSEASARLACATVNLFAEAQALAGAQVNGSTALRTCSDVFEGYREVLGIRYRIGVGRARAMARSRTCVLLRC